MTGELFTPLRRLSPNAKSIMCWPEYAAWRISFRCLRTVARSLTDEFRLNTLWSVPVDCRFPCA